MPRKGENIFHRKDGRWEARYVKGYHLDGTYQYGFIYGKSYQEVKQKRTEILLNLNYVKKKNNQIRIKLNDKITQWLEKQKLTVKMSTYSYYYSVVNRHILRELGNLYIQDINEEIITKYINKKIQDGNLKMTTVKEIVIILKQILNFCDIDVKVKLPKTEKIDIRIFNSLDKKKLEEYIYNNINNYTIGILLSLYAGLRIGEVCALKWEDINFSTGIISIKRTVSRINDLEAEDTGKKTKLVLTEAKTKNSVREIPLNCYFMELLQNFKKDQKDEYFVISSNRQFIDPRTYYNQYKRILKKCGIANYKYHTLRHTFATNCIELGLDPKSLSEILGHSDIKITLSLYVHPSLEIKKEFMNKKFVCQNHL